MKYRVIQWATGGVGRAAIEGILSHPELELVGCWVHSAAKSGKDVGELAGIGKIGVEATNDTAALLALDADCVMYSPIMAKREEVIRILEVGQERRHAAELVLPEQDEGCRPRGGVSEGWRHAARHGIHPAASPSASR
jgi:hypothetical protein